MEKLKRNINIDIIKTIAIILVVFGHAIQYGCGQNFISNSLQFNNMLFKVIYSFHMPLFMIISGYLFNKSVQKYDFDVLILKKFKELFIPIVSFSVIEIFIKLIIVGPQSIVDILSIIIKPLWFLWAVFIISLIMTFINKKLNDSFIIICLLFIITFFLPSFLDLHLIGFMYPYFVIGYFVNKYSKKMNIRFNTVIYLLLLLVCLTIYVILFKYYNYNSFIYTTGMSILHNFNQFFIDIYRFIIGLIGSSIIIFGVKLLNIKSTNNLVVTISTNTLGIYAISNLIFKVIIIVTKSLSGLNYIVLLLETLFTMIACLIIIKIISKSSIASKLFLGKQELINVKKTESNNLN